MGTISFKSVGKTIDQLLAEPTGSATPIGIMTPMRLGKKGEGIFAMHLGLQDQIKDNLRNLILTNHGERLGIHDFGANLRPLTSELVAAADFEAEATERIRVAVNRFMPFIELATFTSNIEQFNNQDVGKIIIAITYDIPALGVTNERLDVILGVM
jgi:phage baseplate assembly protein W